MFYLYHSITAEESMASYATHEEASYWGKKWFVGGGIVRDTAAFNFFNN